MARILVQTDDGVTVETIEVPRLLGGRIDIGLATQLRIALETALRREKAPKRGIVDLLGLGKGEKS